MSDRMLSQKNCLTEELKESLSYDSGSTSSKLLQVLI